ACVRRLGKELLSAQVREGVKAIEVAERFADGYASAQELAAAYHTGQSAWSAAEMAWASMISGGMAVALQEASSAALYVVMHTPGASAPAGTPNRKAKKASERQAQVGLFRCIFGNPFRPVSITPAWRTGAVMGLAQAAYEDRSLPAGTLDPARLPVLADALEDAGCTNAAILDHCHGPGPHVRGCWILDLLLGKK